MLYYLLQASRLEIGWVQMNATFKDNQVRTYFMPSNQTCGFVKSGTQCESGSREGTAARDLT